MITHPCSNVKCRGSSPINKYRIFFGYEGSIINGTVSSPIWEFLNTGKTAPLQNETPPPLFMTSLDSCIENIGMQLNYMHFDDEFYPFRRGIRPEIATMIIYALYSNSERVGESVNGYSYMNQFMFL